MICPPCRQAGEHFSRGQVFLAAEAHDRCSGGCDCAHVITAEQRTRALGNYSAMIRRTPDGSDPLVPEPGP
jgi:hypothetical protein